MANNENLEENVIEFIKWFNNNKQIVWSMDELCKAYEPPGFNLERVFFFIIFSVLVSAASVFVFGGAFAFSLLLFSSLFSPVVVAFVGSYRRKKWENYMGDIMMPDFFRKDAVCYETANEDVILHTISDAKKLNFKDSTVQSLINQSHTNGLFWRTLNIVLKKAVVKQEETQQTVVVSVQEPLSLQEKKQLLLQSTQRKFVEVEILDENLDPNVIEEKRHSKNRYWEI